MMIIEHPLTRVAVELAVNDYLEAMSRLDPNIPPPRWMKLQSRPAFVLRHAGGYASEWRIVRRGSYASASATYHKRVANLKWGGIALVLLPWTETHRKLVLNQEGRVEWNVSEESFRFEIELFHMEPNRRSVRHGENCS